MPGADVVARKAAFDPLVDANTRLLILGSLPGEASLTAARYYAHPRNAFWQLTGDAIGRDLVDLSYPDRLRALRAAGVGLWDVIATAERRGSLDAAIRNPETADLNRLVNRLPALRAIAFNGATAARLGRRSLTPLQGVTLIDLPSSSPAHARPLAEKQAVWSLLSVALGGAQAGCDHVSRRKS